MISSGEVRKRTNKFQHIEDESNRQQLLPRKPYDPKYHFILLGFICFIIIIVILITIFYAPSTPKQSQLSEILNAYFSGQKIFEINFDSPPQFTNHIITNSHTQNILQQSIDKFYGKHHCKIIQNNGWNVIYEGQQSNKPGLVCLNIGCIITIKITNIISQIANNKYKDLYLLVSYKVSDNQNEMGIAKIWMDTMSNIDLTSNIENPLILDGFERNTKAVSKYMDWKVNINNLKLSDELYFHAMVIQDSNNTLRMENQFKILGFGLHLR